MKTVLFVCTHNAGRSQMAEAFFNRMAPDDVRAESAGQQPRREGVRPTVVEAMREVEAGLDNRRPQKLSVEMQLHADWPITLACGATCPYVPTTVEDWDIPDPAGKSLEDVRGIRDQLELRVANLIEHRVDAIRADRSAHHLRLQSLLPGLAKRFPELPPEQIRSCADAVLSEYSDVPVRSFVMAIADRQARECLATGGCAVLA